MQLNVSQNPLIYPLRSAAKFQLTRQGGPSTLAPTHQAATRPSRDGRYWLVKKTLVASA